MTFSVFVGFFGLNRSMAKTIESIKANIFDQITDAGATQVHVAHFNLPDTINSPRSGEVNVPFVMESVNQLRLELSWVEPQADSNIAKHLQIAMDTPVKGEKDASGAIRRNTLQALHSLMRLSQLADILGKQKYDMYCLTRADLLFLDPLPIEAAWKMVNQDGIDIITPNWHKWTGLNDRFAICSPRGMEVYLNRIDCVPSLCHETGFFHSESLLKHAVERSGLSSRFIGTRAQRVRSNGMVTAENFLVGTH